MGVADKKRLTDSAIYYTKGGRLWADGADTTVPPQYNGVSVH